MTIIRPFKGVRPAEDLASFVAALPYDVYNRKEAKEVVAQNPLSFLKIDRAETMFPDDTDMYSQAVYEKARDMLAEMIADGTFVKDEQDCYYLYALTMDGRTQTGIVGCASIDDYLNGIIRKHENTREEKELDRIEGKIPGKAPSAQETKEALLNDPEFKDAMYRYIKNREAKEQ